MYSEEGRLQRKNWILKIAFPAEDINSKDFVETTIKFLDKFNVIYYLHGMIRNRLGEKTAS